MSDKRLRRLERLASSGDPQAGARLLLERVRVGELERGQLELAAFLEDPLALLALERESGRPARFSQWLKQLKHFGEEALVRSGIAVARAELPAGGGDFEQQLDDGVVDMDPAVVNTWLARRTIRDVEGWVLRPSDRYRTIYLEWATHAMEHCYDFKGLEATCDAVAGEVVSWALGLSDSVLDRCRERDRRPKSSNS